MSLLIDEAKDLMEHGYHERAIQMFREGVELEPGPEMTGSILDNLGYCFLTLGWFEEAAKSYFKYLKIHPSDIDGRFFLASAPPSPSSFLLSTTIPMERSSLRMGQFSMIKGGSFQCNSTPDAIINSS